jgi:ABC-type nitrate/sulfonate/bicarbonate transport system permease component
MRGLVLPAFAIAFWEGVGQARLIQSDMMSRPSEIAWAAFAALRDGSMLLATGQTIATALVGLLIGSAIGISLGAWFGLSSLAGRLSTIAVELFRPIPSVALIPIAMLVFGFGFGMGISIVAFACMWPALIITQTAVREVPRELMEVARGLELKWGSRLFHIVLPDVVPDLFTALRLGAGISLIVAVTVEITANPLGLGYALVVAQETLHPATMYAYLVWIGLMGWVLNAGLLQAQKRWFGRWSSAA